MSMIRKQAGFTLIAAIFLLVVVAGLVVYMANVRVVQQTTLVYGVQGARALQAARSGIEWGIERALNLGACAPTTGFTIPAGGANDFNVSVDCIQSTHDEAGTPVSVYQLTARASSGAFPSLDFVQRSIRATVSVAPP